MGEDFRRALVGKEVPILVLDQKWHRLFAVHGKPDDVKKLEAKLNKLLAKQGKCNSQFKELKKKKNLLMEDIMKNMTASEDEPDDSKREKKQEDNKKLMDAVNKKMEELEEEMMNLPSEIHDMNQELMIKSMEYFYAKLKVNAQEAKEIDEWITQIRIDLKKNIIRKQNREINNREIYAYLHALLGAEVLDIFDVQFDKEGELKNS